MIFKIHDKTSNGAVVFEESHTTNTNNLGLFNVIIGKGKMLKYTLDDVEWGDGAKFLQVGLDPLGGNDCTDMGTTQLMSVPYALSRCNGYER